MSNVNRDALIKEQIRRRDRLSVRLLWRQFTADAYLTCERRTHPLLSIGRRNRIRVSLEMRAFLKLNA